MSLINAITETVILPGRDFLLGQSVAKHLKFLQKSQWWSKDQIEDYQNEKLRQIIKHSVKSVPHYRSLFDSLNLAPEDIQTKGDLRKLPLLNKSQIKAAGIENFTSETYPKSKMMQSSSSGSTGEPLFYYNTKEAYSLNIATNLRGWYWMGYRLGDKFVKLSQNPRNNKIKRLQDKFSNNLYLSTNPLTDDNFEKILRKIESYHPKVIRCYPDPLLFLARYLKKNPYFDIRVNSITTTGNTLFPERREEIEFAFGCKIFDAYSCEGNSTLFECPTNECYHSSEEYGITEILDENGNSVTDGIGRLITTDLHNLAHPFIRYDTQDLVEVSSKPCSCGRKLLRINRIVGRDNDVITSLSGQRFIVHSFTGFFQQDLPELKRSVDQFQVKKCKDGSVVFNLTVNNQFDESVEKFIQYYWEKQFKQPVYINVVQEISLTKSGKRRFIIDEI